MPNGFGGIRQDMMTKLLFLISLSIIAAGSDLIWAQDERELLIEPRLPDSGDLITISVTNSRCYGNAEVFPPTPEDHSMWVRLTYLTGPYGQCLQSNPDAPDFETTIGPIPTGDYSVALFVNTGTLGSRVTDEKSFSVIDAPPAVKLSEGGITGLYYDPDADGHYVYVLETDYTTLIVWTTFDADGNQAWVYGTGELKNGNSVVANAYINRNGRVSLDGNIDPAQEEHWGWLRVDMTSCGEGVVSFHSDLPEFGSEDLPEFGSGQFPIERLAFAKQIGCAETE